jgi:hypothetical protein
MTKLKTTFNKKTNQYVVELEIGEWFWEHYWEMARPLWLTARAHRRRNRLRTKYYTAVCAGNTIEEAKLNAEIVLTWEREADLREQEQMQKINQMLKGGTDAV